MALFSSGRDALSVVAEANGFWNWCFIGPNAETLPLIAGGNGSVEEMRQCLANHHEHAVIFGLLRLPFGTGRLRRSKFVFVVASNEDSPDFRAVKVGQAMAQRVFLEKEFGNFVHFTVVLEIKRASDLTVDHLMPVIVQKVTVDGQYDRVKGEDGSGAAITAEDFKAAQEEEMRQRATMKADSPPESEAGDEDPHEDDDAEDGELQEEVQKTAHALHKQATKRMSQMGNELPADVVAAHAAVGADLAGQDEPANAQPPAPPPAATLKWSTEQACPVNSDETRFAQKGILLDKYKYDSVEKAVDALNAEQVEMKCGYCVVCSGDKFFLLYHIGSKEEPLKFKFAGLSAAEPTAAPPAAAPSSSSTALAPEEPPRLAGLLLKQATNFFADWQLRAFEVSRGRVRYWTDWASKTAGYRPKYEYSLLNAQVDLIKSSESRFQLTLKGSKAVERAPYLLMANIGAFAGSAEAKHAHPREDWVLALVAHTVYAKKDLAYRRAAQVVERALGGAS